MQQFSILTRSHISCLLHSHARLPRHNAGVDSAGCIGRRVRLCHVALAAWSVVFGLAGLSHFPLKHQMLTREILIDSALTQRNIN